MIIHRNIEKYITKKYLSYFWRLGASIPQNNTHATGTEWIGIIQRMYLLNSVKHCTYNTNGNSVTDTWGKLVVDIGAAIFAVTVRGYILTEQKLTPEQFSLTI